MLCLIRMKINVPTTIIKNEGIRASHYHYSTVNGYPKIRYLYVIKYVSLYYEITPIRAHLS